MKKILILASILMLSTSIVNAKPIKCNGDCPPPPPRMEKPCKPNMCLDKKLNLTDEQKVKAKEIRMKGHEQIKPLFEELKTKQEQKRAIINGNLNKKEQLETIDSLNKDIRTLKQKIREVRAENSKEFREILTPEQQKTLDEMKVQARKDFKKNHRRFPGPRHCPCAR